MLLSATKFTAAVEPLFLARSIWLRNSSAASRELMGPNTVTEGPRVFGLTKYQPSLKSRCQLRLGRPKSCAFFIPTL